MTKVLIYVADSPTQELHVVAKGAGVRVIEGWPDTADIHPDEIVPDPLLFLSECVALGFLPGADRGYGAPALVRRDVVYELDHLTIMWRASMQELGLSVIPVLVNILLGRGLDVLEIRGFSPTQTAVPMLHNPSIGFPPPPAEPGFEVDYQAPQRRLRARYVRIEFEEEPDDAQLGSLYHLLEVWVSILLLGAFPLPGRVPAEAGVIPEIAALTEPHVVEQTFEEAFYCDEQAFWVLLHALRQWNKTIGRIRRVEIR